MTARQLALEPKRAEFLAILERVGNLSLAAREVGIKTSQGASWARAAGVENVLLDRSGRQTEYTRLRAEGATQKAAAAAVASTGAPATTGTRQPARPPTAQPDANDDAGIAYTCQVTTAFAEPDTISLPAEELSATRTGAPPLALVPEPEAGPTATQEPSTMRSPPQRRRRPRCGSWRRHR